jgi:predicted amidohydrolase
MRALLVQKDINNKDYTGFLKEIEPGKTDIVCFGELATWGCMYTPRDVPQLDSFTDSFNGRGYPIMIGVPYKTPAGVYNTYMYYDNGEFQLYRKINLFPPMNEDNVYLPGTEPGLFETRFGRFGIAICYDLRFPEVFSSLKENGAEIIFVPAAWPLVRIHDWKNLLVQRAKDNNIKIVGINAVGDDGTNEFGGSTTVVDHKGQVLSQADETTEKVIEVEL